MKKNNYKKIKLNCANCGKDFDKRMSDYTFRVKKEIRNKEDLLWFCSMTCVHSGAQWDDKLSPFKFALGTAKARSKAKNHEFDLTVEFLMNLWKKQKGLCGYSKLEMDHPFTHSESRWEGKRSTPFIGSLDRIDCSKGYIESNVHFICLALNLAKASWSEDVFKSFLDKLMHHSHSHGEVVELVDTTDLKSVGHK